MDDRTLVRFMAKVNVTDTCWLWTASVRGKGYGAFGVTHGHVVDAHRVSYEHFIAPIPESLHVLHHCDTPPCVRPEHLFVGTAADNIADMYAKGRNVQGERASWAKVTEEDVRAIRTDVRSYTLIAADYSISPAQVCRIRTGKNWAHVVSEGA